MGCHNVIRLLLLECQEDSRASLLELLTCSHAPTEYKVSTCSSGPEALDALRRGPTTIDLVLVGSLPPTEVTAGELLKAVGIKELRHIPVVVLVEDASQAEVMALLQAGAAEVLFKPLRRNEVATLWQHVWRRRASCAPHSLLDLPQAGARLAAACPPAAAPGPHAKQRPACSSHHSGESQPASDNSSSSALRADVASALREGAPVHPPPSPAGGASGALGPHAAAATTAQSLESGDTRLGPWEEQPRPQAEAAQPGCADTAPARAAVSEEGCVTLPREAEPKGSTSLAEPGPGAAAAASPAPQEGTAALQAGGSQAPAARASPERAYADSLLALRLAVRQPPPPLAPQLGIKPLTVAPLGTASSADDSLQRLASLVRSLSAEQALLRPSLGQPMAPASAPPFRAAAPQVQPLKRAASPLGAPPAAKRLATPRTKPLPLSQQSSEEIDGPARWRAHRQEALARWKEKRLARKFTKTVRYESRRRLAAARPRVRGQFVKAIKVEA